MAKASIGLGVSACGERGIAMSYGVNTKAIKLTSSVAANNPIPLGNAQYIILIQFVPFSELNSVKEIEYRHGGGIRLSVERVSQNAPNTSEF